MSRFVEIRSYTLKPEAGVEFHRLVVEEAIPMLARWRVDVVAYGASAHDSDTYYLMRAYNSLEERQSSQDAFYGSDEWRQGPREAIVGLIETLTDVVIEMDDAAVGRLRQTMSCRQTW